MKNHRLRQWLLPVSLKMDLKMKLTVLFTLISLCQLQALDSYSQKVSLDVENATYESIFKQIEAQTAYTFFYNIADVDAYKTRSLKIRKKTITEVLAQLFQNTDIQYRLADTQIILTKTVRSGTSKKARLKVKAQQRQITGTVTNQKGEVLPGVNIFIKDTNKGLSTNFEGQYQITVPNASSVLIFSHLGYQTQEVLVGNQTIIHVTLQEAINKLEEIVLNTGYYKTTKEQATGSYEKINNSTLETKIAQNILTKIEGEIPGILFDANDGPTIRGLSSIDDTTNRDPLLVVDGFPVTQDLSTINPNNVESITVLKDAAAASIWGLRAANGVIVIVTKKGSKNQKPVVEFSTRYSITPQDDLHDLKLASTPGFLDLERHFAENGWRNLPFGFSLPPLSEGLETFLRLEANQITEAEANAVENRLSTIDNRNEFEDLFMSDETWTQYNLSANGGGEYNRYRASFTYNRNESMGSYKENDQDELIANIQNSISISPKLTFNGSVNYVKTAIKPNSMSFNDYNNIDQYQSILDANGNFVVQPQSLFQPYKEERVALGYPYNWDYNLKQEFDHKNNKTKNTQLRLQTSLKYDITDFLSVEGLYQYEWSDSQTTNLFNESTYRVRNITNVYTTIDNGNVVSAIPKGSIVDERSLNSESQTGRFQLNYDQSFNSKLHQVTAIAGYEIRKELFKGVQTTKYGFNPRSLTFANINFSDPLPVSPFGRRILGDPSSFSEGEDRFISYYGNAVYTYDGKYALSASTRLDDANLFGADKKYKNIPLFSVGGKWVINNEDFFNSNLFNALVLRATYGSNGNVNRETSPFVQLNLDRNPNTDQLFGYISNVKNPSLRLETTYVTNVGIDFGILNNRINGSIEYYKRRSDDLLAPVSFPSLLGFNTALINAGEMQNTGIDIGIRALVLHSKKFKYNTTFNFSFNKNEVTRVEVPEETVTTYLNGEPLLNRPLRYLYSYKYAGLDGEGFPQGTNENGELIDYNGNKTDENGNLIDAQITNVDALNYEGTTTPKYYGAWINNFEYKGLSLRVLTTFKLGHVFRNTNTLNYGVLPGNISNTHIHEDFENRWKNPGDENTTDIPRIPIDRNDALTPGYRYYVFGNNFVDSASHIRVKEIIVSYNLASKISKAIGLNNLNISAQARDIGVITFNKWNMDPENFVLPLRPTFTLSLSTNF
ncbi:SusC/RagA family TonB-linked outer membrane protein [uncultured Polaribacter sp.]|uniref:SusC/RagA family TonB-linked outer membrane protein n=1 Tax=uncultured Polaribacter sp. TaxID=174711 RepID=UPI002601E13D|nr:SusC/RagA family TonB-linked outer membrane protein [uncultured Polaribacter sp.]